MVEYIDPKQPFSCAICIDEFLLRYCQKKLTNEEQLRLEKHLVNSIRCWENLVRFNQNFSKSYRNTNPLPNQPKATNTEENIKIADRIMAEYFLKKKDDQVKDDSKKETIKSDTSPSSLSWENLTEPALLASMFPIGKTTNFIVTKAWQEFFRRYEQTIINIIIYQYKSIFPNQKIPNTLLVYTIESVFKYLQQNNYKKLRELRDYPEISVTIFLKVATHIAIMNIEPFSQISEKDKQFLNSALWQEKKNLLIKEHGSAVINIFYPEANNEDIIKPLKQSFHTSNKKLIAVALAIIATLPGTFLTYYLYSVLHSKSPAIITTTNNQPTINTPNSYELFDQYLDDFLRERIKNNDDKTSQQLIKMEELAKEMASKEDNSGNDLVTFYRNVSSNSAYELYQARTLSSKIANTPPGDNYDQVLLELQQADELFNKYSDHIGILKNNLCRMGSLIRQGKFDDAQKLINEGLAISEKAKYRHFYTQFLLEKGNLLLNNSEYEKATQIYLTTIDFANKLEDSKLALRPILSLTAIYYIFDRNEECFNLAQKGLAIAAGQKNYLSIQLLHLAGVSAFNIGKTDMAEQYLDQALSISQQLQYTALIAQSYMFIGIVETNQNKLSLAENVFKKALETINQLQNPAAKADMEINITGYYARQQMLAGNADRALDLYEKSISLINKINHKQFITLSQLHKGKAEVLISKGNRKEAATELQLAIAFEKDAKANSESTNSVH